MKIDVVNLEVKISDNSYKESKQLIYINHLSWFPLVWSFLKNRACFNAYVRKNWMRVISRFWIFFSLFLEANEVHEKGLGNIKFLAFLTLLFSADPKHSFQPLTQWKSHQSILELLSCPTHSTQALSLAILYTLVTAVILMTSALIGVLSI